MWRSSVEKRGLTKLRSSPGSREIATSSPGSREIATSTRAPPPVKRPDWLTFMSQSPPVKEIVKTFHEVKAVKLGTQTVVLALAFLLAAVFVVALVLFEAAEAATVSRTHEILET